MSDAMDIDTDSTQQQLYDRQIHTYGMEAMKKITQSTVLISGMNGVGIETAKNIVLSGVHHVIIHDTRNVELTDLSAQFYLNESDVGKNRAAACHAKLAELNQYVKVDLSTEPLTEGFIKTCKVVVLCSQTEADIQQVGAICHTQGIKFIVADALGCFSRVFVDFGNHRVVDPDGENPRTVLVSSITKENPGVVSTVEETPHMFMTGEHVVFSQVEGMTEINEMEPVEIKVTGPYNFTINDTTGFSEYTGNGYVSQVKMPVDVVHESYEAQLHKPEIFDFDFLNMGRAAQLHIGFLAVDAFCRAAGRMPRPHDEADAQAVLEHARQLNGTMAQPLETLDERILSLLARVAAGTLGPVAAVVGGIVGQEVIKAITNKYMPLKQWLYYECSEILPSPLPTAAEAAPQGTRYDGQTAVLGAALNEAILDLRYFLVGAGAIGCEMLKNWAMMGLGCGPNGHVHVTDMDNIETSNLSRQFLFRPNDVQKMKAPTAAQAVQRMNDDLHIEAMAQKVGPDTEEIFDDRFFENLSGVCNALDNVQARLYMDSRCVYFRKPLLESGTLGTKCNSQVVVPNLTESYASSRDPPEKDIPLCTLKNFPHLIEHTIEWARSEFEGRYNNDALEVLRYMENPQNALASIRARPGNKMTIVRELGIELEAIPRCFADCVAWARKYFEKVFANNIKQLLHNFPPNATTAGGVPFWSGVKRQPTPAVFDPSNQLHRDFIQAAAALRASMYNVAFTPSDLENAAAIARTIDVPPFIPAEGITIETEAPNGEGSDGAVTMSDAVDAGWEEAFDRLPKPHTLHARIVPVEFEKDDDRNHHIDFITATSNLRATNYSIPTADRRRTKQIAGRIIPAIATTTALVTGFVCVEIYKLAQDIKELGPYRNWFSNLALPFFGFTEPVAAPKLGETNFTLWDRVEIDLSHVGDPTLRSVAEHLKREKGWELAMVSYGVSLLYMSFFPPPKQEQRLGMPLTTLVQSVSKQSLAPGTQFLNLEICATDENDEDIEIPPVRVKIPAYQPRE